MSQAKKARFTLPKFTPAYYGRRNGQKLMMKYLKDENIPFKILKRALEETKQDRDNVKIESSHQVAHLFSRDLRVKDNVGLHLASQLAAKNKVPLVGVYVYCLEWLSAHSTSKFQLNYQMNNLHALKKELEALNVPLFIVQVEDRKSIKKTLLAELKKHNVKTVFSNTDYEVDELRLHAELTKLLLDEDIAFYSVNDTCVVEPGILSTKTGSQFKVFKPWYNAWLAYVKSNKETYSDYEFIKNETHSKEKSDDIPPVPKSWELSDDQKKVLATYGVGTKKAEEAVRDFIANGKLAKYTNSRSELDVEDGVSHISHYLTNGIISLREVLRILKENKQLFDIEYVRQLAWRDFYKHVLAEWPFICMHQLISHYHDEEFDWLNSSTDFEKWCEGKTGFPVVDAVMRQLNATGYVPNRGRMIVGSFLLKQLLIDWRYGEDYFMKHLIDGDFASNNGGWGFVSSFGTLAQPWFRILNPWTQSEKYALPEYLRRWVKELDTEEILDKDVHNPYGGKSAQIAKERGYPEPMVDHTKARERALEWYDHEKDK